MKNDTLKNDNASERAAALVLEAVDILQRAENAPDSPINTFLTADMRRRYRRAAKRLREKSQPRYTNLHSAEELAEIYERAIQRDEIIDQGAREFKRITRDLGDLLRENLPEFERTMETLVMEAKRLAEEQGLGSQAALRYRYLQFLAAFGGQAHSRRRNPRAPFPWKAPLARDPSIEVRRQMSATEVLDSPPSEDDVVIAFPPEGSGPGRPVIYLRIGIGLASWIGSFEIGDMSVTTIAMMPGDKHLFVSAEGAGYIVDLKSRTLVEKIGTDVAGVMVTESGTVFVVDHDGTVLEAFGSTGRLWKTAPIGSGGFRELAITDTSITGEARDASGERWTAFSVELATGEVRFGEAV